MENDYAHSDHCNWKKIYCHQCRKVIFKKDSIQKFGNYFFCSQKCGNNYGNTYTKCKTCSKKTLIANSVPSPKDRDIYFCSLECLEKNEPESKKWGSRSFINDNRLIWC